MFLFHDEYIARQYGTGVKLAQIGSDGTVTASGWDLVPPGSRAAPSPASFPSRSSNRTSRKRHCEDATMLRGNPVGSSRRRTGRRGLHSVLFKGPHRIGRPQGLENPPEGGILTNGEPLSPFHAEPTLLRCARTMTVSHRHSCIVSLSRCEI
jgi:hypothetical protein